ncbi:sigma 54-interacting transcriptional regulator [Bacillus sp. AGMB 02131]|uniref:Sigma 54-interacting transcriptional regulator n=1 Tax=Peribacillus faecalis TaxID=2772559 RepID=A0A927D1H6_9BACI|nr:sigma 54-interacting transcriptional regulator [Peribacillus faecalis]MBD3109840.1 sigma 54-interacting transcriptional regulator [Peribacillus faecalis]
MISKEILEAILKVIDEGIHVIDLDGRTIFYNDIAAAHDGMKVSEVIGKHVLEVFPSLTKDSSTLLQVIESEKPLVDQSQTYVNVHGATIDTVNTTVPIYVKNKLVGAVEVAKDFTQLRKLIERLLELEYRRIPTKQKRKSTGAHYTFEHILTDDSDLLEVIAKGKRAALSQSPILVYGESGTGKELFVQGIHNASTRRAKPFIAQNCAALPETLLESLLFGTAKGSYTGAIDRAGLFELADGGTLFLDEIQSMSPGLQAKLLRVLEDGVIRRIGSTKSNVVDVRVIAAMNMHPEQALVEEKLRLDLFYRLNVSSFHLPPLRERKNDIALLAYHFIDQLKKTSGQHAKTISAPLMKQLELHSWPGNVRELKHCIEHMMNVASSPVLLPEDLPVFFTEKRKLPIEEITPLREALQETEKTLIQLALTKTEGNVLKAAKLLKIPRQTLQYKMKNL